VSSWPGHNMRDQCPQQGSYGPSESVLFQCLASFNAGYRAGVEQATINARTLSISVIQGVALSIQKLLV
jgi:hypothetical protein